MQRKILKISTIALALTTIAAVIVLWQLLIVEAETESEQMSGLEKLDYDTAKAKEEKVSFSQQLRLELPEGAGKEDVKIENDYVKQLITIKLPKVEKNYFEQHPLLGRSDHIDELHMDKGVIDITMDAVYEVESTIEDGFLYIDFCTPQEIYDKVVVIDAGHGGKAPGAIKQGVQEKDLNLGILLKLKELLDKNDKNIGVYYTRTEDNNPTFEQRAQLANKANANLFISIHNNSTTDGQMFEYNGTEVMYDEAKSEEGLSSKHLAEICLEETTAAIGSKNNGITHGNSIYIIRSSKVPVALIEVGFMTNQTELDKLMSEDYQKQVAQGIYNAIIRALEEGY